MVSNVTSLTGNGLKDWLIQRVTALGLAIYVLIIASFLWMHPQMDYTQWSALFASKYFQVATVLAMLAILLHSWVGIWTVSTDYIQSTSLRISMQVLVAIFLLDEFVFGIILVWGR